MRFIAVIVFLLAVAIAVAWFAYQNLDRFGQNEVIRWLTVISLRIISELGDLRRDSHTLPYTESRCRPRANRGSKRENSYHWVVSGLTPLSTKSKRSP